MSKDKKCEWKRDNNKCWWNTTCEHRPWFSKHPSMFLPCEVRYIRCPFCGGVIKEVE